MYQGLNFLRRLDRSLLEKWERSEKLFGVQNLVENSQAISYRAECTHRLVVIPEYVGWWFRTVENYTSEVDGAPTVNVQVWTTDDISSWLCKQT
jgi:hypothetical protein